MKKDKVWLLEKHRECIQSPKTGEKMLDEGYELALNDMLIYIDQLDEPEKPIIPQFVADWIESYRKKTLVELINDAVYSSDEDSKCFRRWFHEEMGFESNYSEFLARAWLDGYEVEKELYYYVAFEGEFNLLYVTHVDIYGENGKFNYNSVFDKKKALKFTDKSRAKYLADFLGAIVVEVTQ